MVRRLAVLVLAATMACGPDTTAPAGTDDETSTDGETETEGDTDNDNALDFAVTVDSHQFECSETCSSWSMRNELTLVLASPRRQTITVEWTRTEIDGVLQSTWSDPIDIQVVEIPAGGQVAVRLSGRVDQCNPGISGRRTGRFFIQLNSYTFEFVETSTFISVPRPPGC